MPRLISLLLGALLSALLLSPTEAQQTTPSQVNGGIYNATPPTLANKQAGVFQLDANGNLLIKCSSGCTGGTVTIGPGTSVIGYTSNDPCSQSNKTNVAIATSSGNVQLVAPVAAKKVYICSFHIIAAAAAVVNIIEGTGSACTTANEAAIFGSTTAANGESLAANGGLTYGNGGGTIGATATAANGVCLLQSGTTALAGNITFVQQ